MTGRRGGCQRGTVESTMSFKQIDDVFAKHGWSCTDTIFRDRDGQLVDPENVIAALPEKAIAAEGADSGADMAGF